MSGSGSGRSVGPVGGFQSSDSRRGGRLDLLRKAADNPIIRQLLHHHIDNNDTVTFGKPVPPRPQSESDFSASDDEGSTDSDAAYSGRRRGGTTGNFTHKTPGVSHAEAEKRRFNFYFGAEPDDSTHDSFALHRLWQNQQTSPTSKRKRSPSLPLSIPKNLARTQGSPDLFRPVIDTPSTSPTSSLSLDASSSSTTGPSKLRHARSTPALARDRSGSPLKPILRRSISTVTRTVTTTRVQAGSAQRKISASSQLASPAEELRLAQFLSKTKIGRNSESEGTESGSVASSPRVVRKVSFAQGPVVGEEGYRFPSRSLSDSLPPSPSPLSSPIRPAGTSQSFEGHENSHFGSLRRTAGTEGGKLGGTQVGNGDQSLGMGLWRETRIDGGGRYRVGENGGESSSHGVFAERGVERKKSFGSQNRPSPYPLQISSTSSNGTPRKLSRVQSMSFQRPG